MSRFERGLLIVLILVAVGLWALVGYKLASAWQKPLGPKLALTTLAPQHARLEVARRRQAQAVDWMKAMIEEHLRQRFFNHPAIKARLPQVETAVTLEQLPVTTAVQELLTLFEETGRRSPESD